MEPIRFQWDFALDGKSLKVNEGEDGDLFIEGYAADFDLDRDGEHFDQGALSKALTQYMTNPVLCFHHKLSEQMGRIMDARIDRKGVWLKARVARPEPGTERMNRYMDVKRGDLRGFSIGGFFKKVGRRIAEVDWVETSLTPTPVNPRTLGAVAGKALEDADSIELPLAKIRETVEQLEQALAAFE